MATPSSDIRISPSGREVSVTPSVLSVFGRVGDVVAEPDDYDTDQVDNVSTISGASFSDALDALAGSDSRLNDSLVPGATVSDALDFLLANISPYVPGTTHDTFSGGIETGVATVTGQIGDFGWNMLSTGSGVIGPTCSKQTAAGTDAFGLYRITTPTAATGTPAGFVAYLGSGQVAGNGPLRFDQLDECTWRCRFDTTTLTFNLSFFVGFQDNFDPLVQLGIYYNKLGIGGSANFQCLASRFASGTTNVVTTVAPGSGFHELRIVRNATADVEFFIDGVSVAQITDAASIPTDSQVLIPVFKAITLNSGAQVASFMDVDDFELIPVAA